MRKHCPWTNFGNLTHGNEHPFTDLATDIANGTLPQLAFIIPNQCDNSHDCPASTGDTWLSAHVPAMLGALGPNGLLILTWDEGNGLDFNHIVTVFHGPMIQPGEYAGFINHYNVLRTVEDLYGLPHDAMTKLTGGVPCIVFQEF